MHKFLLIPLLISIVFLQSCVTTKISSNKDADYNKHPKKIFIMMNTAKEANDFCGDFLTGIKSKFKEKGIESASYSHTPLSLETNEDINKLIYDYSPEAVMVIKQKVIHSTNKMVDGGTFEISLIDNGTRKTFWKSEFEVYGQLGISGAVNKSIDELFKKLIEDKVI